MPPVYVTKSFLPPEAEYIKFLDQIWHSHILTNQGPLLKRLEEELRSYLEVDYLQFLANGTLALELALDVLGIQDGEVITTPFSYVATTSAVLWQRCTPVFVDIEPDTLCLDPARIEAAVTSRTRAVLGVHVFGYPCDLDAIEAVASRHGLKVVYDAAHAFGVRYRGRSLLDYGDAAACSFHATKLFHTVEGGCCVVHDEETNTRLELAKRFGHNNDDHLQLGINAKNSEFHAAMGLCNLKHFPEIVRKRRHCSEYYDFLLAGRLRRPVLRPDCEYNYGYYPVIFESEKQLLEAMERLRKEEIYPRRYFWPSLNQLPYLKRKESCPVSEATSARILCLPLFPELEEKTMDLIVKRIFA